MGVVLGDGDLRCLSVGPFRVDVHPGDQKQVGEFVGVGCKGFALVFAPNPGGEALAP